MKKLLLSIIAFVACTMSSYAQDDLVATLSHGSNLTTYTGIDALSEAYSAAAAGDIITLSPGMFNAVDIEKAITVRGAGMIPMESNGYVSTQLAGEMVINVPSNASSVLTIEGVQALGKVNVNGDNLAPVNLLKCRFEEKTQGYGVKMNAYSCIFAAGLEAYNGWTGYSGAIYKNTTINCMNCVIMNAWSWGYFSDEGTAVVAKIEATNCIVKMSYDLAYSSFTNCIMIIYSSDALPKTCSAQNCIGISTTSTYESLFRNIANMSNIMIEDPYVESAFATIFKTLRSLETEPAFTETFELTETAAATYLGDDGMQVGIYGGTNPYNPTPTNPQIKKFTVNSTTEGTTLKVKINVE